LNIKKTYHKLRHLGITLEMDFLETKRLTLLNEICIWTILLEFFNHVLVILARDFNTIISLLIIQFIISVPLVLNYFQKTEVSKWFLLMFGTLMISFLIILLGKDFNQDYCYLLVSVLIIILLPKFTHRVIHLGFVFTMYLVTKFYLEYYPPLSINPNGQLASTSTFTFIVLLIAILLWRFVRISKNIEIKLKTSLSSILQKNHEIEINQFQIKQQNQSLEQVNKELEHFAFIASNDLQSPLNDILENIGNIKTQLKCTDIDIQEYLDYTISSAEQMKIIIQDVLAFSKIEDSEVELKPTNLNRVITSVLLNIKESVDSRNAEVDIPLLPTIQAMDTQITLLFQNLIENGIKYNTSSIPKVSLEHEENEQYHIFNVQDNGIGISETDQVKVFEMFKRLKEKREEKGSGIGLAICKKIIERHKGTINIESEIGKGTTFRIFLPKVKVS